jgi:hypothetical protein
LAGERRHISLHICMALPDRPDFQAWLAAFEARHEHLHGSGSRPARDRCDGCGEPLATTLSSTGLCLVCLAEQYGRDRAQAAARIAGALRIALTTDGGTTPIADVREAVEEVLADYDAG